MPNNQRSGSAQPPSSRRDRRESSRRDRRMTAARTAPPKPFWQQPMFLLTVGAVAVGLVVVIVALSGLTSRGSATGALLKPIQPTPMNLIDPTNPRALGPADAPVTVDIWSDFQCPFCGDWARTTAPTLISEYVATGKVRLVYRDYAFLDGGDPAGESQQSAAAARCAGDQGKFWPFHDYLFENQSGENEGAFRRERLDQIATAIGLDMTAFGSCMSGTAALDAVKAETAQGKQAGVTSTPTLAIDGVLQRAGAIPMADTANGPGLRTLIDAALAKALPAQGGSASPAPTASATP